jgi:hypothetical protein
MPSGPPSIPSKRRFCLVLVKPTHYCDDGYPIRWFRSAIPSNSLACICGIAEDCAERSVLGEDVEIEIHAFDESNTRIRPQRIAALVKAAGAGMVMLVGVQSNQTPLALDIARPLRAMGIQVVIGGFHMSGVISMIDGDDPSLREAQAMGVSIFAGEAEGRLDDVLRDAYSGQLKPLYDHMNDLPGIDGAPFPILKRERLKRTGGSRRASMPGEAARISARSAPSSTCRGAHRVGVLRTISRRSFEATWLRGSFDSSSRTTISPGTKTGRSFSIG